jgi:hypothetical protein
MINLLFLERATPLDRSVESWSFMMKKPSHFGNDPQPAGRLL